MKKVLCVLALVAAVSTARAQAPTWAKVDGQATDIAVGADGTVWVIGYEGSSIWRRDAAGTWKRMPGAATRIAVDPKGAAWVVNSTHSIFKWNGTDWTPMPGAAIDIGIGADGSVWVLGTDQVPYRFENGNWKQYEGGAVAIAVDPKGQPWVVNSNGDIFTRDWTTGWRQVPGKARDIAVDAAGNVFVVGGGTGPSGLFHHQENGSWAAESQGGVRVTAGPAGVAYVTTDSGSGLAIWQRTSAAAPPPAPAWTRMDGQATDIAVGADGTVWVIGYEGSSIWRRDAGGAWKRMPGGATRIAVDPKGAAWVVNSGNVIYKWNGTSFDEMPGRAIDIGIGADGSVWVLGTDQVPYRFENGNWKQYEGGAVAIAVDPKGQPWVVNSNGDIFTRDWTTGWKQYPGKARDIAVDAAGNVFVVGAGTGPGGGPFYHQENGNWAAESQAGVRVSAGPAGVAYVTQDAASSLAIWRRALPAAITSTPTTITLTQPTTAIVVSPTTTTTTTTTSTGGTVTTGALTVSPYATTTSQTPLAVSGLAPSPTPYPANLPQGAPVCPLIEGTRLTLGCDFKRAKAVLVGPAHSTTCPSESFFDPQNGGECWSCPSGFIRNSSPVTANDSCWKAVSEDLQRATYIRKTGCAAGTFFDPRNGGECWSCPSGYNRTWDPVTYSTACSNSWAGPFSYATKHASPGTCDGGSFFDPRNGGECWKCPDNYRRTLYPVSDYNACAKTVDTQYQAATVVRSCSIKPPPYGYGIPFREDRNGGECWTCPLQYKRANPMPVDGDAACHVGGSTDSLLWRIPQFPDPGVQAFARGIAQDVFRDAAQVDAYLNKRAAGNASAKAALWTKMETSPNDSPELKAILFTGLLKAAKNAEAGIDAAHSIAAFESYVKNRRLYQANEASSMYEHWLSINAKNQYDAARAALGGFAGIGANVLGGAPGDFTGTMASAARPDDRGGEFINAFQTLGQIGAAPEFLQASTIADDGFDPTVVIDVWDGIFYVLDTFELPDALMDAMGAAASVQSVVGGAVLGLQLARQAVELTMAINVLVDQAEGQRTIDEAMARAAQPVSVKQILTSGAPEQVSDLVVSWATATSPHRALQDVGQGSLTDADLCNTANAATYNREACDTIQWLGGVVRTAKAAVPAPAPSLAPVAFTWKGMGEYARVTSVDPAAGALRFRLVDLGKMGTLRGPISGVVVGATVYLDTRTSVTSGRASIDGQTDCCSFALDMGTGSQINR